MSLWRATLASLFLSRSPPRHGRGFVFALLVAMLLAPQLLTAAPSRPNCRLQFRGITYCIEDRGATHVLIVDLANPSIRVQSVMANDVLDVRPLDEQRERVDEMAQRYRKQHVVIAINGDYFGADRGPEGPIVVQGQRLDTLETIGSNPSRYRRTSLALSRFGRAAIVAQLASSLNFVLYRDMLFNAISGGPIILRNGAVESELFACVFDRIPASTCRRARQSVAGVDAEGTTLYLAVSTVRSTGDMARLLLDYGAHDAMKLDGGSSSQLWYNGRTLLDSDRGVANALLVFVEDRPRHAAKLMAGPSIPIVTVHESASIQVDLRNDGFLNWTRNRGYGLHVISETSMIDQRFVLLPRDTQPGEVSSMVLTVDAPSWPDVYESTWQMFGSGEGFGAKIPLRVIIVPPRADDLRSAIQALVTSLEKSGHIDQNWPRTAQRIRTLIRTWLIENPQPLEGCRERPPC